MSSTSSRFGATSTGAPERVTTEHIRIVLTAWVLLLAAASIALALM